MDDFPADAVLGVLQYLADGTQIIQHAVQTRNVPNQVVGLRSEHEHPGLFGPLFL